MCLEMFTMKNLEKKTLDRIVKCICPLLSNLLFFWVHLYRRVALVGSAVCRIFACKTGGIRLFYMENVI